MVVLHKAIHAYTAKIVLDFSRNLCDPRIQEIFEKEMLIRHQLTTLLEIFCDVNIHFKVVFKRITGREHIWHEGFNEETMEVGRALGKYPKESYLQSLSTNIHTYLHTAMYSHIIPPIKRGIK